MGIFTNYCGLGGSGPLKNKIDALCKKHDELYAKYQEQGYSHYWAFNQADKGFLRDLSALRSDSGGEEAVKRVAQGFFQLKKALTFQYSHEGNKQNMPSKRLRDESDDNPSASKQQATDKVNVIPDDNEIADHSADTSPASNLMMMRMGGGAEGNGRRTVGQETPILWAPRVDYPGPTATRTVYLTSKVAFWNKLAGIGYSAANQTSFRFRPTSLYSIYNAMQLDTWDGVSSSWKQTGPAKVEIPFGIGAGAAAVTLDPVPGWRPYYEQFYQKYAVTNCHYTIRATTASNNVTDIVIASFPSGPTSIPTSLSPEDVLSWKGVKKHMINSGANAAGRDENMHAGCVIEGNYKSGDFGEDVVTDSMAETWTAMAPASGGAAPTLAEWINVFVLPSQTSDTSAGGNISFTVELKYTVQFKGLYSRWEWPTTGATQFDTVNYIAYGRYP